MPAAWAAMPAAWASMPSAGAAVPIARVRYPAGVTGGSNMTAANMPTASVLRQRGRGY